MRNYHSDLSRRLGPLFAEQAAPARKPPARQLPVAKKAAVPAPKMTLNPTATWPFAVATKPSHGGYPTVDARA